MQTQEQMQRAVEAISALRIGASCTEAQLHSLIYEALLGAGLPVQSEVRLAPRCRIDLMVGAIGVEIKKSRPVPAQLARQLARYAACPQVEQLLVLAPRAVNMPKAIAGKRVVMMGLERLWGISLP